MGKRSHYVTKDACGNFYGVPRGYRARKQLIVSSPRRCVGDCRNSKMGFAEYLHSLTGRKEQLCLQ